MLRAKYHISHTLFRMLKFCPKVHYFHDSKAEMASYFEQVENRYQERDLAGKEKWHLQ